MSYRKNLLLSLGPIQAAVDLNTVVPSTKSNVHRLCAEHKERIKQNYRCPEGDHDVEWGTWVLGTDSPDGYKLLDENEKPKVDSVDSLSLVPVPTKELEASTFEGPSVYYAEPSSEASKQTWAVFHKILKKRTVSLVTKGALRTGSEKLWRVTLFRDYLVLREIVFPENIKDTPTLPDTKVDKPTTKLVQDFVDTMMTEWGDVDTTDLSQAAIEEWIAQGETIDRPEGEKPSPIEGKGIVDLQAALAKAIEEQ